MRTQKKLTKNAISVYNPECPYQKAVQDAYHAFNNDWLTSYQCYEMTKAIMLLKFLNTSWTENIELFKQRIKYFFEPELSRIKKHVVFLTTTLFLDDILENQSIEISLYNKISFVTTPIAYYLFREYNQHILIDLDILKSENKNVDFLEIGGIIISTNQNVKLSSNAIVSINNYNNQDESNLSKAAVSNISKGIFKIDEDERKYQPGDLVWNKQKREFGQIEKIENGVTGIVEIKNENNIIAKIQQKDFDTVYSLVSQHQVFRKKSSKNENLYNIIIDKKNVKMNEKQISNLIKEKLSNSKTIQNLCKKMSISIDIINNLKISIEDLHRKYGLTDEKVMKLNKYMFDNKRDFLKDFFYVCPHEITHFLARNANYQPEIEGDDYFGDEEEVLAMVVACAYLIEHNEDINTLYNKAIKWHFEDNNIAKTFFNKIQYKAKELLL